jgi:O-antigen/teichoic acid export membrane protein
VVLAISSIVILLCGIILSGPIQDISGIPPTWQWAVLVAASGQFMMMLALTVWQVQGRARLYGITQVANTALNFGVTVLLVTLAEMGWEGRALAQAFVTCAVGVIGLGFLSLEGLLKVPVAKFHIREALRFGLPLVPHGIAGTILITMDRLLLVGLVGAGKSGIYFAAFQVSACLTLLASAVNQAWIPWLYKHLASGDAAAAWKVTRVTYILFSLLAFAAVLIILFGPSLITLLAGSQFADSAALLVYLGPAAAFRGMYFFVTNYIFYAQRTGVLSAVTSLVAVLQAILTVALVHIGDETGAAIATLISAFLYFVLVWYQANRLIPMPWSLRRAT